jgi:hypothetical protein
MLFEPPSRTCFQPAIVLRRRVRCQFYPRLCFENLANQYAAADVVSNLGIKNHVLCLSEACSYFPGHIVEDLFSTYSLVWHEQLNCFYIIQKEERNAAITSVVLV